MLPLPADELQLCSEQLWPQFDRQGYRVIASANTPAGWIEVERHRAFGRRNRIDMILPVDRLPAARALSAYPGLRPFRRRMGRLALAAGLVTGLVGPVRSLALISADSDTGTRTVMQQLREALSKDISAAMHVRRAANRKALLQVVDDRGNTLGFAKLARNDVSLTGIRNEIDALTELDGGSGTVRTPRVLLSGESGGFPFVFSEPLPSSIRGCTTSIADTPTIAEFADLAPVRRWGSAGHTGHVKRLRARLRVLPGASGPSALITALGELLAMIDREEERMPIAKWSHGDFAFWNTGRARDGTLWCWDFENVEIDALAGLDVLHWHASRRRVSRGPDGVGDRVGILSDSADLLAAFGVGSAASRALLYRTYIADIGMRTLETAYADGWQNVWARPDELEHLVRRAWAAD